MKIRTASVAAVGAALLVAPSAFAHIEIKPKKVAADSFSRFVISVPTEEAVPTVKVSVKLPAGLDRLVFQPKPGWKRAISGRVVTWSGGEIAPDETGNFVLSAHVPATTGRTLVFAATQTHSNGTVVRWIGAPSSDTPAPRVTLAANEKSGQPPPATTTPTTTTATSAANGNGDDDGAFTLGLVSAGLAVGLIALGLWLMRRRRT